jgi:hypothetical protein
MTFATWSQTAASNTSVGGISTDGTVTLVKQIDNMFRGMMAELAVARDDGTIDATGPRGYINGLILSNNAGDATNDIDISAGECTSSASPYWRMALASTLTKRLDAAWAVGTGNGGLDTGSIANTTYHVWLIQRSDTLVVDALFSASATAPTMPANYDRKSYVGPIIRAAAAILPFTQINDTYYLTTGVLDYASASAQNNVLQQFVSIPTGVRVQPLLSWSITATTANITNLIGSGESPTAAFGMHNLVATGTAIGSLNSLAGGIYSNTSGQLRLRVVITSGTITTNNITTLGWIHDRGRTS